jgi:hypothetical protein
MTYTLVHPSSFNQTNFFSKLCGVLRTNSLVNGNKTGMKYPFGTLIDGYTHILISRSGAKHYLWKTYIHLLEDMHIPFVKYQMKNT